MCPGLRGRFPEFVAGGLPRPGRRAGKEEGLSKHKVLLRKPPCPNNGQAAKSNEKRRTQAKLSGGTCLATVPPRGERKTAQLRGWPWASEARSVAGAKGVKAGGAAPCDLQGYPRRLRVGARWVAVVVPAGHVPASQLAASLVELRKWWPGEWPKASPAGTKPNRRARKGIPVSAKAEMRQDLSEPSSAIWCCPQETIALCRRRPAPAP